MALVNCAECGKEVSSEAPNCPNCGVTVKRKTRILSRLIGYPLTAVAAFIVIALITERGSNGGVRKPAAVVHVDKSPTVQKDRRKLLQKLSKLEVFGDVRCSEHGADVVVKPSFFGLDFDTKQRFLGVVYAHCFDGTTPYVSVTLLDSLTNKDRGTFTAELGLKLK